jgi:hypothetical protein
LPIQRNVRKSTATRRGAISASFRSAELNVPTVVPSAGAFVPRYITALSDPAPGRFWTTIAGRPGIYRA